MTKRMPIRGDGAPDVGPPLKVKYTNWRGETAEREISPVMIWLGITEWHKGPIWLLHCFDWGKSDWRDYALSDCDFTDRRIEQEKAK